MGGAVRERPRISAVELHGRSQRSPTSSRRSNRVDCPRHHARHHRGDPGRGFGRHRFRSGGDSGRGGAGRVRLFRRRRGRPQRGGAPPGGGDRSGGREVAHCPLPKRPGCPGSQAVPAAGRDRANRATGGVHPSTVLDRRRKFRGPSSLIHPPPAGSTQHSGSSSARLRMDGTEECRALHGERGPARRVTAGSGSFVGNVPSDRPGSQRPLAGYGQCLREFARRRWGEGSRRRIHLLLRPGNGRSVPAGRGGRDVDFGRVRMGTARRLGEHRVLGPPSQAESRYRGVGEGAHCPGCRRPRGGDHPAEGSSPRLQP